MPGGEGGDKGRGGSIDTGRDAQRAGDIPEAGGGQQQPSVTVGMLNRQGRAIVTPLVEEFIDEVGPEVSRRCIIQLC